VQAKQLGRKQKSKPFNDSEDVYDYEYRLQNAISLVTKSEKISQKDKEHISRFLDLLRALRVSKGRLAKYVFHLKTIGENIGLEFEQATRKDIEHFTGNWLYNQSYSAETVADFIMVLKRFYKFLRFGNVDLETPFPEEVRWLKKTIKPNERRQPEFLTPQEVETLIRVAETIRHKAMIAVQFDGGFRPAELLLINIGDVHLDEKGARVRVRGKTGERTVRLVSAAPLLSQYIETHPFKENPEAPLWLTDATNYKFQRVGWRTWNNVLKRAWIKSGIKKPRMYSRMLRHGSATENARFLSDSELKVKHGWTMSSRMPAVYVQLSGKDLDDKLVSIYSGKAVKPPTPEFTLVICPRCKGSCSPGMVYCSRCGTPLNPEELATVSISETQSDMRLQAVEKKLEEALGRKT
jgi:integrase/recombinase XerD